MIEPPVAALAVRPAAPAAGVWRNARLSMRLPPFPGNGTHERALRA